MYKHPRDVLDTLDEQVRATNLPPVTKLLIVVGYPRSDIGKGTLVSHLLALLENSNVIKFDGMLNSNLDGRFTKADHDDFGLYQSQNPEIKITKQNHILGGTLLSDFITRYSETNERLTFVPHLERFFRLELQKRWKALGEPQHLIVEMGGTPDDSEASYTSSAIRELKAQLGDQCRILLLTELGHNNIFAKSKVAQRGISELVSRGIVPDIIVTREPRFEHTVSTSERLDYEIQLQERIAERTGLTLNIIAMPYFTNPKGTEYRNFVENNLLPIVQEPVMYPKLLLGTTDQPEIEEWKTLLGGRFDLVSPQSLGLDLDIISDNSSIQRSSHARARSFCRLSGLPTITTEAGLYINALDGRPGAGIRTWGGKLSTPMSNEEIFNYLRTQVEPLEDTSGYLESVVTLLLPNGEEHHTTVRDYGVILKDRLARDFVPGEYPIGQVFRHDKHGATWAEMTDEQRRQARKERLDKIRLLLSENVISKRGPDDQN